MDKVRIGGTEYDIKIVAGPLLVNSRECKGKISYDLALIEMLESIGDQAKEETLWHEILHGIVRDRNLSLDDEEEVVETFARGLHALVKDNKLLPGQG
ncbi:MULTISPECIES: hypothetical protein [unclassified Dehalobacter]|jgi:hypothetical protein|uniref:hypothetical protein n=1 Tax=unclassified Dehalobacter TaxID=2635733 RepID=UPI00028B626A|nr:MULTISPECIES: hypothetical protein [unclassified Dehalobacter]AFV05815.1 hypothetical protein DCF50_p1813 [Dehalobacter sp. CF]